VLTAYFPLGILSSFIAKQAEQPGSLNLKPESVKISNIPSSLMLLRTLWEPGTSQASTLSDFLLPLIKLAKSLKSSILPFVQLPKKT
jgi:hypothetical protein